MYGVIDAVGKIALIPKTKRQPLMTAPTQKSYWLVPLFWLIFFTTMIMRGPHNVVGPMAQEVCDFYGMTWATYGILAGIPMATFGIFSLVAPTLIRRFGPAAVFGAAVLGIVIGSGVRVMPQTLVLFAGTLLFSMSIANLNILMPTLVKTGLTAHQKPVMGIYSALIGVSGLFGTASTGVVRSVFPDMTSPFLFWSGAALLCLVFLPVLFGFRLPDAPKRAQAGSTTGGSPIALLIGMMAFQATLTTCFASYSAAYFVEAGFSKADGTVMLNLFMGFMVFGSLIAGYIREPAKPLMLYGPLTLVYLAGIAGWGSVAGGFAGAAFSSALLGTLHGAVMAFAFIAVVRKTPSAAILKVSGYVQFGGYFLAGIGPWLAGVLVQRTGFEVLPWLLSGFVLCWSAFALLTARHPDRDAQGIR